MKHFKNQSFFNIVLIIVVLIVFVIVFITISRQIGAWFRAEAHQKKKKDIDEKTGDIFSNIFIGGLVLFIALLLMKGCFDD